MIDATRDVVVMNDGELAKLTPEGVTYYTAAGQVIEDPRATHADWNLDVAEKGGYPDHAWRDSTSSRASSAIRWRAARYGVFHR